MKRIIPLFSLSVIIFLGCSNEESPTETNSTLDTELVYEQVVTPQENNYNLLENLLNEMDTLSAMDSVLNVFLQDSLIEWGKADEQGIAIQYKSGIRGGIFFNPLDIPDSGGTITSNYNNSKISKRNNSNNITPNSKKTIFINPHYSYPERKKWADQIIDDYNDWFPAAGYQKPIIYKDGDATLQRFEELNGYGVIHIYSHGWAWPSKNDVKEVYLMTGERYSAASFNKYKQQIVNGIIPIVKLYGGTHFYISPKFISDNNNFKTDTTLIYGGFCTSYLGSWPETMHYTAGAGGYFGFDWIVNTDYACKWSLDLFDDLTNTSNNPPTTVTSWMNNSKPKWHWQPWGAKYTNLKYLGYADLALLEKSDNVVDFSYNWCEIHFGADGIYDSPPTNAEVSVVGSGPGSFTSNKFTAVWNNTIVCLLDTGRITVTIDHATLMAEYSVIHYSHDTCFDNDITYTSYFEGSGVPLSVTENNTLEFQVYGLDACSFASKVESERRYENGDYWSLLDYNCTVRNNCWFYMKFKNN